MLGRRLCRLPFGVPTYFQSSNTFSFREGNFLDISKPKLEQRQKNVRRIVFSNLRFIIQGSLYDTNPNNEPFLGQMTQYDNF